MRPHLWVALVVGVLVAATCTSSGSGSGDGPPRPPSEPERLVVTFTAGDRAEAVARFGEGTRRPVVGSHCWEDTEEGSTLCMDTGVPTAENVSPVLQVPQGTELVIEGSAKSVQCFVASLRSLHDTLVRTEMTEVHGVLDQEPGKYVLECRATWPQGHVPFSFGVEIMPPGLKL